MLNYNSTTKDYALGLVNASDNQLTATGNGFNGLVSALAYDSGTSKMYVGGSFSTSYIGATTNLVNNFTRFDSTGISKVSSSDAFTATGNGFNSQIYSLGFDASGTLYVGGSFNQSYVGNTTASNNANSLAKITFSSGNGTRVKINTSDANSTSGNGMYQQTVYSFGFDSSSNVYIGGQYSLEYVGNSTAPVGNILKLDSSGAIAQ